MTNDTPKNYSPLRFSKAYGNEARNINLGFNKQQLADWLAKCPADDRGNVKLSICPRKSPSETNAFTMFQDTWKPDANREQQPSPRPAAPPADSKPPTDDDSSVPF